MKKYRKFSQSLLGVAIVTLLLLLVPLVAMQFSDEVAWSAGDFMIAGALLFGTGAAYVVATVSASNIIYRAAMGLGLGAVLFMIWANLAVGLIGAGAHAGNLMYAGVVVVAIIGIVRSRFRARAMAEAMYAVALSLAFVAAIALLTGMDHYPGSSMKEILGVNAFLATPFVLSGLLFRFAAQEQSPDHGPSEG